MSNQPEFRLYPKRATSADNPLPDGHSNLVRAPEDHGHWNVSVIYGQQPAWTIGWANNYIHIRGGKDTPGPTRVLITWVSRDGKRSTSLDMYLSAGPKSVPDSPRTSIDVSFLGPVQGKIRYSIHKSDLDRAVNEGAFRCSPAGTPYTMVNTYQTDLIPDEFSELYDAVPVVVLRKVETVKPEDSPKKCPTCQGKGYLS